MATVVNISMGSDATPSKSPLHHAAAAGGRPITLREWFVSSYCEESAVEQLLAVQACTCGGREAAFTRYFHFVSDLGSGTFYVLVIPLFVWSGFEHQGIYLCFLLSLGLYVTDVLKDTFACPRPPSPPVRRGGSASHAQEYGWPSTHTTLACLMAWETCRFFLSLQSEADGVGSALLVACLGLLYVAQIAYSRMYLGLHWAADVAGGFAIFVVIALLDAAFLRRLAEFVLTHHHAFPYFFVWLLGHLAVLFHATPRDPCPCFEDSVRFIGVDIGAFAGVWCRKRNGIAAAGAALQAASPAGSFASLVMNQAFIVRYVVGIVLVVAVDVSASFVAKRLMPPLMRVLAGSLQLGRLQPLYGACCCVVGVVLGKELYLHGSGASGELGDKHKGGGDVGVAVPVAVSTDSSIFPASPISADVMAAATGIPAATGRYWSLRNHNHWWEADIQAKLLAYAAIGFTVSCAAPYLFSEYDMG